MPASTFDGDRPWPTHGQVVRPTSYPVPAVERHGEQLRACSISSAASSANCHRRPGSWPRPLLVAARDRRAGQHRQPCRDSRPRLTVGERRPGGPSGSRPCPTASGRSRRRRRSPWAACSGRCARRRRRAGRRSSTSTPSRTRTMATTSLPQRSLGRPATTQSYTPGWARIASSTSSAKIFSPPELIVTASRPCSSMLPSSRQPRPVARGWRSGRRRRRGRCAPSWRRRRGSRGPGGRSWPASPPRRRRA